MKTILLTGATGFFGWNALRYWHQRGWRVVPCSLHPERYRESYGNNIFSDKIYPIDIAHHEELVQLCIEHKPDAIVHAAALSQPAECESNPLRAYEINVVGTANVFGVAAVMKLPFIFLSTDLIFDGNGSNYAEHDEPKPLIVYGETKLAAETAIRAQSVLSKWAILRCSLMFGDAPLWRENAFPEFALRALRSGKKARLFSDQYRTPVFVDDVSEAVLQVLEHKTYCETFHVGGLERLNRVEFIERFCSFFSLSPDFIESVRMDEVPEYRTKVRDVSLNSRVLQEMTEWKPTPLEEAFSQMRCCTTEETSAKNKEK